MTARLTATRALLDTPTPAIPGQLALDYHRKENHMQITDLFAGPGGWSTGLRTLGLIETGIELDPWACATRRAAGHGTVQADVTLANLADYDATDGLIASPPCRPWSPGGLREGHLDRSLVAATIDDLAAGHDTRNSHRAACANPDSLLAAEPMRWIRALRPQWVAMEQVPAVLPLWQQYARHLTAWGYSTWTGVLNAADYGVPQSRRRAVLLASRTRTVHAPAPSHAGRHVPMHDAIDAVTADTVLVSRRDSVARLAAHGPRRNRTATEPAPTITGEVWRWKWQDDTGTRSVTPSEAGVLQTFPADYPWQGPKTRVARQIGDAVPPLLAAHAIAVATGIHVSRPALAPAA
ncbi:DNA cytosine methyltransferase [Streptomyces sp. NPDC048604]|uniref:DNA cytosine methyltransferase n=1 Tax=Streptomyces sp. NPDC048604 TaxID=3365578 RepID=UPI00371E5D70